MFGRLRCRVETAAGDALAKGCERVLGGAAGVAERLREPHVASHLRAAQQQCVCRGDGTVVGVPVFVSAEDLPPEVRAQMEALFGRVEGAPSPGDRPDPGTFRL